MFLAIWPREITLGQFHQPVVNPEGAATGSSEAGSSFPYSVGDTIDEDGSEEAGDDHQAGKDGQKPILDHLQPCPRLALSL
ncbi:hypothetical protein [Bradyrhizobium liaoningense]